MSAVPQLTSCLEADLSDYVDHGGVTWKPTTYFRRPDWYGELGVPRLGPSWGLQLDLFEYAAHERDECDAFCVICGLDLEHWSPNGG